MPLRFVLDENQRGLLRRAIVRHNHAGIYPLDAVRVGDEPDLPLGSSDSDILLWSEREGRILVSFDRATMAGHGPTICKRAAIHRASSHSAAAAASLRSWPIWPWSHTPATPGTGPTGSNSSLTELP